MERVEKKVLVLNDAEQGLMVNGLMDFRNSLLEQDKPTEDINDLILRVRDDCVPFDPEERSRIVDPEDITKNIGIRMIYGLAEQVRYQNMLGLNVLTIRM